ncbi:hypothetical protein RCD94_03615, partial [Klebsiella pneumoniae]|nr:hypothetical protein [Klebsiella pneumoniae]
NGGKNSLNRLIRCVCGKKIGPDPRNFNQRVSLGRNDLLIRTFPIKTSLQNEIGIKEALANCSLEERVVELDMASDEKGRRLPGKRC